MARKRNGVSLLTKFNAVPGGITTKGNCWAALHRNRFKRICANSNVTKPRSTTSPISPSAVLTPIEGMRGGVLTTSPEPLGVSTKFSHGDALELVELETSSM